MAGNIKGITIEFRGETTKLDKALSKIKSESKQVDKELKDVNRALRFNPRNAELLQQKFGLLKQKVDQTEKELRQFKNAERQLKAQGVSKTSAEFQRVRREIIQAESKLKHFNGQLRATKYANITNMGNAFRSAGAGLRSAGVNASIGAAAMIMAGKKLLGLTETQEQAENKLIEIYKTRMGVNKKAAKSTMQVATALQKEGVIGDEVTLSGAQQLATFAKMPATVNKLLPAMDNLLVQQKGYNATADDAKNIANLFGKAMQGQTGALKRVGISFTDAQAEILKTGTEEERAAVLAEVVTQNVGNMNKAFAKTDAGKLQQVKNSLGDFGERLGAALLPVLGQLADFLNNNVLPAIETIVAFIESHPIVAKIAVAVTALLAIGGPLLIFIGSLISAIGSIMTVLPAIGAAFSALAGPVGIVLAIIAALVAIGVVLYKNWDKIKAKAAEIKAAVGSAFAQLKNKLSGIFNSIRATAASVWTSIKEKITSPIRTAVNFVKTAIAKLKKILSGKLSFPKIKLPHFKLSGKFSLKNMTVPHLSVKWYKKGAIFDSPTVSAIGYGEAGPEGIIPLSGRAMQPFASAIAENFDGGGIDYERLAAAVVGALQAVNTDVVINLDGQKIAQVQAPYTNAAVNQLQARQARKLGLVGV